MKENIIEILDYSINNDYLEMKTSFKKKIVKIELISRKTKTKYHLEFINNNDGIISLDLSSLKSKLPMIYDRLDFLVEDGNQENYLFFLKDYKKFDIWKRYFYQSSLQEANPLFINLYFSLRGTLSLVIRNNYYVDSAERYFNYRHEILNVHSKKSTLELTVKLNINNIEDFSIMNVIFMLQSNKKNTKDYGSAKKTVISSNEALINITFEEFSQSIEDPLNYLIYLEIEKDRQIVTIPINFVSKKFYNKMLDIKNPILINIRNSSKVLETVMSKDGYIRWVSREKTELDSKKSQMKIQFAYFINLFYKKKEPAILIYEKDSMTAQDNGFSFFNYLYKNSTTNNFFFIINRNSPQSNLVPKNKVIYQYSLKYFYYLIHVKGFFIASEARMHVAGKNQYSGEIPKQIRLKKHLFLQHGVTAAKKVCIFKKNSNGDTDVFCTSSEKEKNIIVNELGYNEHEVIITGLSRWDNLIKDTKENTILYMPTWRNWLEDTIEKDFVQSNYYESIKSFLNNQDLINFLEKKELNLLFCLHPKFNNLSNEFLSNSRSIKIIRQDEYEINNLISKSAMLISDYSSVMWDFIYVKKPIILYQFDQNEYVQQTGSYVDFDKSFIADIALNEEKTIELIKYYFYKDFIPKPIHILESENWFLYKDSNNSKRILDYVLNQYDKLIEEKKDIPYDSIKLAYLKKIQSKVEFINNNQSNIETL